MKLFKTATPALRAARNKLCFFPALALLLPVFLLSCDKTSVYYPRQPSGVQEETRRPGLGTAQAAYGSGDYFGAAAAAETFLKASPADVTEQIAAWRIIAESSGKLLHPEETLRALENWKTLSPQSAAQEDWLALWSATLGQLAFDDARVVAAAAAADKNNPWQLQMEGKLFLQENRLRTGLLDGLPLELERIYAGIPYGDTRKKLEQRLFDLLHRADPAIVASLAKQATETNEKNYPYALFRLEEARRLYLDLRTQDLAREMVDFLKEDSLLADQSLFRAWNDPDLSALGALKVNQATLALVLPLSGQYGNLAEKIVTGAEIACKGFFSNGSPVQLRIIDSDKPDWLQELMLLPPDVQLVGGPLRQSDYMELKASGALYQRKFFAFLRSLEGNDEGTAAWRFFSSNADQLRAVIRFSRDLGIEYFGALVPDEEYGARMLALFREQLGKNSAWLSKTATYPADKHQEWNKLVAEFLNTTKEAGHPPNTPFQALFLPDSWQNSTIMLPNFFYYRERRQLVMGTMLWEQGIAMQKYREGDSYRMLIFPGAWDAQSTSPSSMILRSSMAAAGREAPDFWVSLGYDFVNMAASLPVQPNALPEAINATLASPGDTPWSGAPIRWDSGGRASQELFVFTPAEAGFTLAEPDKFRVYYQRAWGGNFVTPPPTPGMAAETGAPDGRSAP
ncbi:MAG: hypothetical protein LBM00_02760 [Deltaproteobacteria bacterium]|jgi:hypothetical protein|nr:hypothetical protein [Deltaproteobacteria bacterium]